MFFFVKKRTEKNYEVSLFKKRLFDKQEIKGEALRGLRSFLYFANKGFIRRRHEDELKNQVSCLNLGLNPTFVTPSAIRIMSGRVKSI